jgi:hypothetical protein
MFYSLTFFSTVSLYSLTRIHLDKESVADLRGTVVLLRAEVREFSVPQNVHIGRGAHLNFIKEIRGRKTAGPQSWRLTVSCAEV